MEIKSLRKITRFFLSEKYWRSINVRADKDLLELCMDKFSFPVGRMISESKSEYHTRHPDNLVIFNANLCTKEHGKIWYGDLDVTLSKDRLQQLATNLGCRLYVLHEMQARFNNADAPVFKKPAAVFYPNP